MTQGSESSIMGEQPLLSVKAHVYHIDPKSKKSWIPATSQAVPVSFFYDSTRGLYRVISVEGTKAVINSIISGSMVATKTSQKFLQWSDSRANMVYGLGFSKEDDLNLYLGKFKEIQEVIQNEKGPKEAGDSHHLGDQQAPSSTQSVGNGLSAISTTTVLPEHPVAFVRSISPQSNASSHGSPRPPAGTATPTLTHTVSGSSFEAQLRLENEKLREALAKSSANADKWKLQLKGLEDENLKLMKALEESHANLSRWEHEVMAYRTKIGELEVRSTVSESSDPESRSEIDRLTHKIAGLEKINQAKEAEIGLLTKQLAEMRTKEPNSGHGSHERLHGMESDNRALKLAISDMQEKLSRQVAVNESLKADLRSLRIQFNRQLGDLKKIDDKLLDMSTGSAS